MLLQSALPLMIVIGWDHDRQSVFDEFVFRCHSRIIQVTSIGLDTLLVEINIPKQHLEVFGIKFRLVQSFRRIPAQQDFGVVHADFVGTRR